MVWSEKTTEYPTPSADLHQSVKRTTVCECKEKCYRKRHFRTIGGIEALYMGQRFANFTSGTRQSNKDGMIQRKTLVTNLKGSL